MTTRRQSHPNSQRSRPASCRSLMSSPLENRPHQPAEPIPADQPSPQQAKTNLPHAPHVPQTPAPNPPPHRPAPGPQSYPHPRKRPTPVSVNPHRH